MATVGMSDARFPASGDAYAHRFAEGLRQMLAAHEDLGVYILVLANAAQDEALWSALRPSLARRQQVLAARVVAALRDGRAPQSPEDDLLVFLKLHAIGFDHLHAGECRRAGPWELCFNPIRALRPARMSQAPAPGLMRPFDARGFHFDRPFLAREVLWQGDLAGQPARLLYNKFPFAPLHGLLVPAPALGLPQMLTPAWHGWAWEVASILGAGIAGFGLAYNSYGAYASVNHLHFQCFARAPLPVETAAAGAYPLPVHRCDDARTAWMLLDELHRDLVPYNLIYRAGHMVVVPRRRQGEVAPEPWNGGHAWSEVAGAFVVAARDDYQRLRAEDLHAALARLAPHGAAGMAPGVASG
jgi:hypothetical protein